MKTSNIILSFMWKIIELPEGVCKERFCE